MVATDERHDLWAASLHATKQRIKAGRVATQMIMHHNHKAIRRGQPTTLLEAVYLEARAGRLPPSGKGRALLSSSGPQSLNRPSDEVLHFLGCVRDRS